MNKRWKTPILETEKALLLQESLKISPIICNILIQRGVDDFEKSKAYFRPQLSALHDPFMMKDMDKAVKKVQQAIADKQKILVFGDYDVDGTTAVASMYQFLCSIYDQSMIEYYIPHRYKEGYGISKIGIDYAIKNNFPLIISLDCGIKSNDLIAYAAKSNIEFIVCDHHLPDDELPEAVAILNPKQIDCPYPYKELCGCGIGFKLMTAIANRIGIGEDQYLIYLDLVATAIAADIVPMTGENRILAYYGLEKINKNPSPGIKALMKLAGIQKSMTINNVVFVIAPRVNAAGRMDDAKKAVQLFVETDETKTIAFAEMLHVDNTDRKIADSSITEEALAIIENDHLLKIKKTTVLYKEHWHKGVVGIVASRLIEKYYRPTIVLTKSANLITGSARSVSGFNLYEAIHTCRQHLIAYGGHFAAAGLTLLPENMDGFALQFENVVSSTIPDELLIPEIIIDAEINLINITPSLYNIICQMEPFGPYNMRPIFISKAVIDKGYSKIVKEKHIRFVVEQQNKTITGIGFNMADKFDIVSSKKPIDILFTLDENEWQGNKNIQLMIIDVRLSPTNNEIN